MYSAAHSLLPAALLHQEEKATDPPHHPIMFDEINGLCILKYFVNVSKSVIIVKDSIQEAEMMFEGSDIQITTAGGKYLGASIGNGTFKEAFVKKKVEQWKAELENLAQVATS